jgi:hypothetical protein
MVLNNGNIEIAREDFADSLKYAIREFLRKNLDDPISGSRENGDKFVWAANTHAVLDKKAHKVPFIAISKSGGNSRDLGHDGSGQNKRQSFDVQFVFDSPKNSDVIDRACQLISEIENQQGSGPDYGYDFRPVSDSEVTAQPQDRSNYVDHQYQEQAAEIMFRGIYGGK